LAGCDCKKDDLIGGLRPPKKTFTWWFQHFLGAFEILVSIRLAWRPNRHEKNPWQLAAKYIDFPWYSIFGGLCLATGRQEHLPWRFSYILWRISTAKINLVSGSGDMRCSR